MGILSKIGHGLGKIWKGIKTGFRSVLGLVAKALSSKLGKVLMAAVSVFTLGTAFIAAQGAWAAGAAAGNSFVAKFMEAGGAFVNSLMGKESAETVAKTGAEAAAPAANIAPTAEGALTGVNAAENATSMGGAIKDLGGSGTGVLGTPPGASGISEAAIPGLGEGAASAGGGMMDGLGGGLLKQGAKNINAAGEMVSGGALPAAAPGGGGWLSKAASAAMDFAKSDNGQNIIGSALEGYGRADEMDERMKYFMRGPRSFNPDNAGMKALNAHDYSLNMPQDLAGRRGEKASQVVRGHATRVPYQQQGA